MVAAMRAATAVHAPRAYGTAAVSTSRRSAAPCTAASTNPPRVGGGYQRTNINRLRSCGGKQQTQSHGVLSTSTAAAATTAAASRSTSRARNLTATAAVLNPIGDTQDTRDGAVKTEKVGILLLNLGGPEKLDDVQPFLYNLFADPDIIRLPPALQFLQSPLAALLSNSRAPKSREAYESIGGGSPLRRITARGRGGTS